MQKRRWQAAELAAVADRYGTEGPNRLAFDLGRSVPSVTGLANRLGLRSRTRRLRQSISRKEGALRRTLDAAVCDPDRAEG